MERRAFAVVLVSMVFMLLVSSAWGRNLDDCMFDWFEQNYPEYISPADSPSATAANYYFRYYPETNSYLGTDRNNNHLYYMGPLFDGLWDLGLASDWQAQIGCVPSDGSEQEVRLLLDSVMDLTTTTLSDGLMDQFEPLLAGLLSGSTTSSCPAISTNLDLQSLMSSGDIATILANLPSTITASASYGSGCRTVNGDLFSGGIALAIHGLQINPNTGSINFTMDVDVNNLAQDNLLIGDGSMSGSLTANLSTMNLIADVQFSNFLVSNGARMSGVMNIATQGEENIQISMDISSGDIFNTRLTMNMTEIDDGVYQINTSSGEVNGYTVQFDNLIFDDSLCTQYPVGGAIVFSKGGESWTATFDNNCTGSYLLR